MPYASLAAGFLPVLLFLLGLRLMDSYKLVHGRTLAESLAAGAIAAGVAYGINRAWLDLAHLSPTLLERAVAPLIEETLKAAFVAWLIRRERVGFMVDAGICGFAVGAGFAVVENLYYAGTLRDLSLGLWLARGLGTAVMHGSATAMFAIVTKDLGERHAFAGPHLMAPGLLLATAVHAAFNLLTPNSLLTTAALLASMPLLLLLVFERSERATRDWLGRGLDDDLLMLEQIVSGEVESTRVGRYLESLKARFPGGVVSDMFCLLRIHLELSLRAKGLLIARAAGVEVEPDDQVRANLEEMRYLERAIGPTGRIALLPLQRTNSRDLWQILLLTHATRRPDAGRPAP